MVSYQKRSTTRLPKSLLEEIQGQEQDDGNSGRRSKKSKAKSLSRKEARKQGRAEQKQKKAQYFSGGPRKRHFEDGEGESHEVEHQPPRKKARTQKNTSNREANASQQDVGPAASSSRPNHSLKVDIRMERSKKIGEGVKGKEKAKTKKVVAAVIPRNRMEEEEDAYIAYLERKLGYGAGKQKKEGSSLEEDGLDDLLSWADSFGASGVVQEVNEEQEEDDDVKESGSDLDSAEELSENEDVVDGAEGETEEEWGGIAGSSGSQLGGDEAENLEEISSEECTAPGQPSASTPTAPVARYVPPHLRKPQEEPESETIVRLKKQLKGLLNRMSEQNLSSIIDSIEDLYRNNRRHDVTSSITYLVIEGISSHSMLLDSFVVLHAALISSLHKIIGIEFAAYFVQNVVQNYERHHQTVGSSPDTQTEVQEQERKGKECSNLMVLLSELYNFQVISSVLVFDLIRQLLQAELTEFNVELLLKLMRNSGQQLRSDDPSALKDIIEIVQKQVSGRDEKSLSSRTRFMIETLTNLKNNKLKRNITQNQGGEAVERMKKFLANLSKRKHVLAHDALRVSLEDLHSAESKGKWWLVGAAWGGNPLVEAQGSMANVQVNGQTTAVDDAASDLLKLARKQGMNTDIRRSIFVVLMSSDDYVDACERLSQLNLTEVQQREIVRVLLHCCGNEKTYNPYYALVCQQLCRQSHSYKITLQFCLWDFLRDMGEATVGGAEVVKNVRDDNGFELKKISSSRLRNVAKAYAWWISKDIVNLSILKAVDFTILKPQSQQFLQALLLQTFISSQFATPLIDTSQMPTSRNRSAIEEIFVKATRIENLAMGLVYFLANTFMKQSFEGDAMAKFAKWACQLALDTLRTGVDIVPAL